MPVAPDEPYVPGPGQLPPVFGKYRILKKLGSGGMGSVYLAEDPVLPRRVALKVPSSTQPRHLDRFQQEARAAAQLDHRHLCHVYDIGDVGGLPYFTMHFIEGRALSEAMADYKGHAVRVIALVATLARAMAAAHAADILHRDLKPSNVILDVEGEPVIVDFGLAVQLNPDDTRLTQSNEIIGTPAYMAPEQHAGDIDAIDRHCDIYSLGIVLYELLTGCLPFRGRNLAARKQAEDYQPLGQACPGVDPRLDALSRRALAAVPANRPGSMDEFARELAGLLTAPETPAPVSTADAGQDTPAATMQPADPRIGEEVLKLLRDWGWEDALHKLDERIAGTMNPRERRLFRLAAGMLCAQLGRHDDAIAHYADVRRSPELQAWADACAAFVAYREGDMAAANQLLERAERSNTGDNGLEATIHHLRGTILYKQARDAEALPELYLAADKYGRGSFGFGRVLDTLGMVYATHGDFELARAFYERSLEARIPHDDRLGTATTYGNLGRLLLDWGDLAGARDYFERNQNLCWSISNIRGATQMYNHLGQVELERGNPAQAMPYLNESVHSAVQHGWQNLEAYARKDRARAYLALGQLAQAEADAALAVKLFREKNFPEGTNHARRALARVHAAQGRGVPAENDLRVAGAFFAEKSEYAEAARAALELADVQRRAGVATTLVTETLRRALDHAERSRREALIEKIERQLHELSPADLARRAYERARGTGIPTEVTSLTTGAQEIASMLFLDIRDSSARTLQEDVLIIRRTLNQIWADLDPVLERHQIVVNQYLGDGFMAFARGHDHDARAVRAGLDMLAAIADFNKPRTLLQIKPIEVRVGVSRGSVVFTNVGTYRKIDYTAVGPATNEAARLQAVAVPGAVCVSGATWQQVRDWFRASADSPRRLELKGIGAAQVWDIVGTGSLNT